MPVSLDDIRAAAQRIAGAVERTPCLRSRTLSRLTGAEVWLKFENLQFTASFKERGAHNKLLTLDAASRKRGVIAMSAGNHAQGVAYHATRLGARACRAASASVSPSITTSAPCTCVPLILLFGVPRGITMTARAPRRVACQATPCAWLPALIAITPRRRPASSSEPRVRVWSLRSKVTKSKRR